MASMREFGGAVLGSSWPGHALFFDEANFALGKDSDGLFMFVFWVSVFFFVLLMGLMLLFVVRYRRRAGVAGPRSVSHNTPLELTWTVVPLLIMAVIFFWGFRGYVGIQVAPVNAEEVVITAQKWNWSAVYPRGTPKYEFVRVGATDVPVFQVPQGVPVKLKMSSTDVIHSFWVPDFRTKMDVFPNRYTSYWFQADELGDHLVFCAEYCGDLHSEMAAVIRVVAPGEYKRWVETPPYDDTTPLPEIGATVYKIKGCAACHSVDGGANTGPTWKDLYGARHEYQDGSALTVEDNHIRESILNPGAKVLKGYTNQMPTYQGQMTDLELNGLIAYMKSLSALAPASPLDGDGAGGGGAGGGGGQ